MAINPKRFYDDFAAFVGESTQWCSDASEREVNQIYQTLNMVMGDVERRSQMSKEALESVGMIRSTLLKIMASSGKPGINEVVAELEGLSQNSELNNLTTPIIEALQFQDRLRQNLENLCKVVAVWREYKCQGQNTLDEDAARQFGQRLLECMTSVEERDLIRQVIPGLPEEVAVASVQLF